MQKSSMSFVKGLGAGMIAGAAVTVACKTAVKQDKHHVAKGSTKLIRAMGEIVDGVQTMFK